MQWNFRTQGKDETRRARANRFASLPVMHEHEVGRPHRRRRLTNIVQGQLNVRVDPIYDFWSVAVNTAVRLETLFTIPQGSQYTGAGAAGAIIKTVYHTNMVMQGVLDAPKKLLVKNISVLTRPDMSPLDVNAVVGQHVVTFNTLGKNFWQGHAVKLPGGGGAFVSGFATLTAPQAQFSTANGWPSASNMALITDDVPDIPGYAPPPPITGVLLETSQPFFVTVDPTLTQATIYTTQNSVTTIPGVVSIGVNAWVYLEGIKLVAVV